MTTPRLSGISVVFPCYNDGGTIASMVLAVRELLPRLADEYEIIVVDDGSRDYAPQVLCQLQALVPELKVIVHDRNRGYGAAVRAGLMAASKEFVFYTDGDAQYDPRDLELLAAALTPEVDVVNGYKVGRGDGVHRRLAGALYSRAVRGLFGLPVRDVDCDFRLIRRSLLGQVELELDSGAFCVELVKRLQLAGARFAEVPVRHYPRPYGRSQFFRLGRILRTLRDLVRLRRQLAARRPAAPEPEQVVAQRLPHGE
ncbi:MAG: glycosyltransferase family 2 protein [Dehalococcoidia bacterium]|jgi:glycosyltransferase involved in cell wall biosynthesis|nr:glycosyltransferase family 2 protein [Dehalococcoidia bacterium]MDW8009072.1 glycosyltransferase family 2 protein [Chloroflexota bacterium]